MVSADYKGVVDIEQSTSLIIATDNYASLSFGVLGVLVLES